MLLMDGDLILDRMVAAVDKVRDRLRRATDALERSGVAYAVVGGNAVATWVARVDESAVRNTQDVDILLRRDDLPDARAALENEGFIYRHVAGMDIFLDGDSSKVRDAVHVLFAGERVRPEDILPSPDVTEAEKLTRFKVLSLEALVRVKLNVFRRKDQVHLGDLLDIGLIDETWKARYPPELAARLQLLIDTPEG
jgi:hypothetical protein